MNSRRTHRGDRRDHYRDKVREHGRESDRDREHREAPRPFRSARRPRGEVVFGVEAVRELLEAAPETVRELYLRAGDERRFGAEIECVRVAGGRVIRSDESELSRMAGAGARHQGVVAVVREYHYAPLEQVLEAKPDPLIVIDGVTDPRNLGAILRSAEGASVGSVVLARDRTVGITPTVVKSSAGAWIHMRIARCANVARTLEDLKEAGYWIAALVPGGAVSLYDLDVTRRLALVIGSEGKGVREIVKKTADFLVDIPMRGKVESLNVSVATAVALFEIVRKRSRAEGPSDGG